MTKLAVYIVVLFLSLMEGIALCLHPYFLCCKRYMDGKGKKGVLMALSYYLFQRFFFSIHMNTTM